MRRASTTPRRVSITTCWCKDYPGTQFAKQAEERLAQIAPQPDNPPDRFAFLDYVFGPPSGKAALRR